MFKFELRFRCGTGLAKGGISMTPQWIKKRLESHTATKAAEQRKLQLEANARNMYASMFDQLKARMRSDIDAYNLAFSSEPDCKVNDLSTAARFVHLVGAMGEIVVEKDERPGATIINIMTTLAGAEPSHQVVEISPDAKGGIIGYKTAKGFLPVEKVSEFLLDPIICG
jgi:hypothetical protein